MAYRLEYSPDAVEHLRALSAAQRTTVLDAANEQLTHQPGEPTRNRKQMRPNPLATWELRVGVLRVYYSIEEDPEQIVRIRAVGVKNRNRITIGGEEFQL
jgi:mRNA-degrading endonuclease RelE of RelBE toxin-antitoxin system